VTAQLGRWGHLLGFPCAHCYGCYLALVPAACIHHPHVQWEEMAWEAEAAKGLFHRKRRMNLDKPEGTFHPSISL